MYDADTMEEDEDPPRTKPTYRPEIGPLTKGLALWVVILWAAFHYII